MTNPFAVQPGRTILDPGTGGSIASGLAGVLAQMQTQEENAMKQRQLSIEQAQQQAIQQYYQSQAADQVQTQARLQAEATAKITGQREIGGAVRQAITPPPAPMAPPSFNTIPQPGVPMTGLLTDLLQQGAAAVAPGGRLSTVFGGVRDENMEAAVKAVQGLQPKPGELPTSAKEFQIYNELKATDPTGKLASQYWDLIRKPPGTTVNVGGQPSPFIRATQEGQAKALADIEGKATGAFAGLRSLRESYGMVDKSITGFAANQKLFLARAAAAVGVPAAQIAAANTQELWRLTGEQVMLYMAGRNLGSGTAISDSDRNYYASLAGQDFTKQPAAIKFTVRMNYGTSLMQMQEALDQLHAAVDSYGDQDPALARREKTLRQRYQSGWTEYAAMLRREGVADEDLLSRMAGSGVENPEKVLRTLPPLPSVKSESDSLLRGLPK